MAIGAHHGQITERCLHWRDRLTEWAEMVNLGVADAKRSIDGFIVEAASRHFAPEPAIRVPPFGLSKFRFPELPFRPQATGISSEYARV